MDDLYPWQNETESYPDELASGQGYSAVMATALTTLPPVSLTWPIQPPPTSTRGQLFGAVRGAGKPHEGLDMGVAGDTVLATAPGTVTAARNTQDARGIMVLLDIGDGWEVRHYHLSALLAKRGDVVVAQQPIGVVGASGLPKPWPHLHFEVRHNGVLVNPQTLLALAAGGGGLVSVALLAGFAWFVLG